MDTSVNAANQVVSVGADIAFDADPKFFACLVRFESSSVPTTLPTAYDVYPLDGRHDGRSEERFSRNAETDLVCRLLLEKKNMNISIFSLNVAIWLCVYVFITIPRLGQELGKF